MKFQQLNNETDTIGVTQKENKNIYINVIRVNVINCNGNNSRGVIDVLLLIKII